MIWYNATDPRKAMNWNDLCRKFLRQYLYNANLLITLRDLELIKSEEKEWFSDYLARWRAKATHMVDHPSKVDQVRLFINNPQPTCIQHWRFMPFENFTTLRNIGMLVEEELAREIPTKDTNTQKGKYQNRGKKDNGFISKELHVVDRYTDIPLLEPCILKH